MNFNSPIPRSGMPRFHESSPQRIARDSDATQRLWKKDKTIGKQTESNSLAIEELGRQVNRLRRRAGASEDARLEPFQIVRGADWLTFQVARNEGQIILTADPLATILGDIDTDITATAGLLRFWFYFELTTTSATIATATATPTWTLNQIPIGYVDTATHEADEQSDIYQFLHTNIYHPCVTAVSA